MKNKQPMWILSVVRKELRDVKPGPVDRARFLKFKLLIWAYFCGWVALGLFLWIEWHSLNSLVSWPLAAVEGVFAPDLSIFRRLFEGYESHVKRMQASNF